MDVIMTLSIMALILSIECHYADCVVHSESLSIIIHNIMDLNVTLVKMDSSVTLSTTTLSLSIKYCDTESQN